MKGEVYISCEDALIAVREMRMMDDAFMELCFTDAPEVVELVLRVVLSMPDLHVEEVRTQEKIPGVGTRTVCFDVLARDADGIWYNIEIQKDARGASPKRARYYSSMLDVHLAQSGEEFVDLPNTVVVFITETDVLGNGIPVYNIERRVTETSERFADDERIVYVNGAWKGNDDIGRLMADFKEKDSAKMRYRVLSDRVQSIKEPMVTNLKEGNMSEGMYAVLSKYSDAWERKGRNEGADLKAHSTARAMLREGIPLDTIARCTSLPIEEIERLKASEST